MLLSFCYCNEGSDWWVNTIRHHVIKDRSMKDTLYITNHIGLWKSCIGNRKLNKKYVQIQENNVRKTFIECRSNVFVSFWTVFVHWDIPRKWAKSDYAKLPMLAENCITLSKNTSTHRGYRYRLHKNIYITSVYCHIWLFYYILVLVTKSH